MLLTLAGEGTHGGNSAWGGGCVHWRRPNHTSLRQRKMTTPGADENEAAESYFAASEDAEAKSFEAVPPSLPELHQRHPGGLNRPYRGVGVEGPRYAETTTGAVWIAWVILGIVSAMVIPYAIALLVAGEWGLVLIAAPIFGLLFAGIVRTIHAEHVAKKKKIERMDRRLRDMNR